MADSTQSGSKARITARTPPSSRSARIAVISSRIFLAIVLLQVPLFRVPCRTGTCRSPLEVTAVQLASSRAAPQWLLKSILFPGASLHSFIVDFSLPTWDNILIKYNMINVQPPVTSDLLRLEILAGSYFAVAGALVGVVKQGRMSMFGMLLIAWGLIKEGFLSKNSSESSVQASPALIFALALGFLSVRYDFNKLQTLTRPVVKPLKSSTKSKIK